MFAWLAGLFSEESKKKDAGRVNLVLHVSPEIRDRILRMQKESGARDLTEVCRWVFAVYEELLEIEKKNGVVIIEDSDGQKKRLLICPKKPTELPAT